MSKMLALIISSPNKKPLWERKRNMSLYFRHLSAARHFFTIDQQLWDRNVPYLQAAKPLPPLSFSRSPSCSSILALHPIKHLQDEVQILHELPKSRIHRHTRRTIAGLEEGRKLWIPCRRLSDTEIRVLGQHSIPVAIPKRCAPLRVAW